jgi:ribose-phosphate pyrophosphokinase
MTPPLLLTMPGFDHAVESGGAGLEVAAVEPERFANGELVLRLPRPAAGRACILIGTATPPEHRLVTFLLAADTLTRHGAASVRAVLPYLAYTRQDRPEDQTSLACAWLGALLRASGVDDVLTVDVHSGEAARLVGVPVSSLSSAALLASALDVHNAAVVVAPDHGARARARELADALGSGHRVAWLEKRRTAEGVVHTALHGELGPRAVVVDDILDTGGTLVSCCRELRRHGVQTIDIAVTHGLFTGEAWRELLELARTIHVTDTVPEAAARATARIVVHRIAPWLTPACIRD